MKLFSDSLENFCCKVEEGFAELGGERRGEGGGNTGGSQGGFVVSIKKKCSVTFWKTPLVVLCSVFRLALRVPNQAERLLETPL
jgi:hypothetical protein